MDEMVLNQHLNRSITQIQDEEWNRVKDLFPFPEIKKDQLSFIQRVLTTKNPLLVSATTGVGKTAALLVSLLAVKKPEEKVIIFVRTKAQINVFLKEFGLIYRKIIANWDKLKEHFNFNLPLVLTILGKNELCVKRNKKYPGEMYTHICSLTKCTLKQKTKLLTNSQIKKIAKNLFSVYPDMNSKEDLVSVYENTNYCPYYVNFILAQNADVVITSYPFLEDYFLFNYLFNRLKIDLSKAIIAVDEAHNLFQVLNLEITKSILEKAVEENNHPFIQELLEKITETQVFNYKLDEEELKNFEKEILKKLNAQYRKEEIKSINAYIAYHFIKESQGKRVISDTKRLSTINPLPSTILRKIVDARKIVMMSGSFEPIHSFQRLFSLPKSEKLQLYSTNSKNSKYMILSNKDYNGKFQYRDEKYFLKIAKAIDRIHKAIPGHVLVFCPSYKYLNDLTENYFLDVDISETPKMDISTVQAILSNAEEKKAVACVVGGKISEGIEFTKNGKSIIKGVIITALPFPPPDPKNQILREELTKKYGKKFAIDFTIIIPTVQRIIQSFGRAIRNENDKAVHILLDPRGTRFNKEFRFERYKTIEQIQKAITNFL
ncbi:MAG: hypothetical protein K9W45_01135 [Candidatus Heimdallarchaeum aukensis]|uniref:Helicase ATP-binding domain-containing protein n=1 Tax=Candidatus Heimdallarchaeum aukensis TaxID=2876573 RepID=A0A9Y1BL94_9ARCH|nr:MAG: hypothetical protein K9W45_01135 [Candidatus Heimdallarchaeum aukensis]